MEVAGSGRCTKTDGAIDGVSVDSMSGFGFAMVERGSGQEPGRKSSNRTEEETVETVLQLASAPGEGDTYLPYILSHEGRRALELLICSKCIRGDKGLQSQFPHSGVCI